MKQLLIVITALVITILIAAVTIQQVKLAKSKSESVTLKWDFSPDSTVTGYKLYRVEKDTNIKVSYNVGNTNQYIVPVLPNRGYMFFVTSYNQSGVESPPTEPLTVSK